LSVYDHAAGIQHVFEQGEPGTIYNVGGGNERENIAVAEQIVAALGKSRSLIRFVQDRPGHDRRYSIDCSRLRTLGWSPEVPFEEGLKQTVEWYRTHEQWWRKIKTGEFKEYYRQQYGRRLEKGTACGSS
jgi:dTDP-glucose 4,6-dehydratase